MDLEISAHNVLDSVASVKLVVVKACCCTVAAAVELQDLMQTVVLLRLQMESSHVLSLERNLESNNHFLVAVSVPTLKAPLGLQES